MRTRAEAERTALDWGAAALVLVTAVAFSLIRVQAINLPWHLATARLAQQTGHWPSLNTFSYTFPTHPAYQQYPIFQATLWVILERFGWAGLSVLTAAGWTIAYLLFVRWGGTWRAAAALHPLWMLGLYALQRRMVLRPDMFSMLALGVELLCLDAYAKGRKAAIAGVPLAHLCWVNSHQLFPVSLAVQGLFVGHLLALRRWPRLRPAEGPPAPALTPAVLALAASAALTFATPLGLEIVWAPLRTAQSLNVFRASVAEFSRVWTSPFELALALATGVPAAWALWRTRRLPAPFDLGLWLLSLALVLAAVRGLMFFSVVSVGIVARTRVRARAAGITLVRGVGPGTRHLLVTVGYVFTFVLFANVVYHRWVKPPRVLGGTQPGLGRSIGGWAESATAFLRASPPPGRLMNMGPGAGDLVIFSVPGVPVFVDSRLESYPIPFLREVVAAEAEDARLGALLTGWDIQWIFAEHFRPPIRERLAHLLQNGWAPVYVDSDYLVIVREGPGSAAYLASHRIDLGRAEPADLAAAPDLRAEQRLHFARLMRAVGAPVRVEEQRRAALVESGDAGAALFAKF